jgi:hypothetical protein
MASQSLALVDVLAQIPDFRQSSGKRFGLVSILSLSVAAMLCGWLCTKSLKIKVL